MTKDLYLNWERFQCKSSWHESQCFYGKVKRIPTLIVGITLDLIIPFTFGSMTLVTRKVFGKNIKIPIHNEEL